MLEQAIYSVFTGPQWVGMALIGLVVARLLQLTIQWNRTDSIPAWQTVSENLPDQRGHALAVAILLTLVVTYGSLVPLNYQPLELAETTERFAEIRYLDLAVGNRADWVANILLFLPLSFFWMAVLVGPATGLRKRLFGTLIVVMGCVGLAICLEFVQIWFPPRTVSQNDIIAEVIGTLVGAASWLVGGPRVMQWFRRMTTVQSSDVVVDGCLQIYVVVLLMYSLMPLDFVASWDELTSKYYQGRINIASNAYTRSLKSFISQVGIDLLKFLPVGFTITRLFLRRGRRGLLIGLLIGWAIAAAVELAQVFIYSRSADLVQVVAEGIGATIGSLLANCWSPVPRLERIIRNDSGGWLQWLCAWVVYSVVLCRYGVEPSAWKNESLGFQERMDSYLVVPFARLYWGTEFHALTEILMKTVVFVPLGALSFVLSRRVSRRPLLRTSALLVSAFGCLVLAVLIELMQVTSSTRYGDVTDSLLYLLGFLIGVFIVKRFCDTVDRGSVMTSRHRR